MTPPIAKAEVARSAGVVALSRLAALVEIVAQPAYVWMFGIGVYGVYTVLWAAVNTASNIADLAMTSALQRIVPQAASDIEAHAAVKIALIAGVLPSVLIAVAAMACAPDIAALVNAGPRETARMTTAVLIFAPALPLWTFIEIATAAARARRAFGPEVRLRLFWEQCVRLVLAFGLFLAGWDTLAIVSAHTGSLIVTAGLSLRLLFRYYSLTTLLAAPVTRAFTTTMLATGAGLLPVNVVHRVLIDIPPIVLNAAIPGSAGAVTAGLFGIARKIATIPQLLQQVFQYVLAPLASAQAASERSAIEPLYAFAARLSTLVVIPLATGLCLLGEHVLWLFSPAALAALPMLLILVAGRAAEAAIGPARPILEMTGHRLLPALNAAATLVVWGSVAAWRVPIDGGVGMAWAVAAGVAASSLLPLIELRSVLGFRPFGARFLRTVALAAGAAGLASLVNMSLRLGAPPLEISGTVMATAAAIWCALRIGLSASDRTALGTAGVRLRLNAATTAS